MTTDQHQPASDFTVYVRSDEKLLVVNEPRDPKAKGDINLVVLDPVGVLAGDRAPGSIEIPEIEAEQVALVQEAYKALPRGGSIVVFIDLFSITTARLLLEGAGFKQLRYIQTMSPVSEGSFYSADCRTAALLAVKGGGSTFNAEYQNGDLRVEEGEAMASNAHLDQLLINFVELHTNPGFRVATTSPRVAERLVELTYEVVEKPPAKTSKKKAAEAT